MKTILIGNFPVCLSVYQYLSKNDFLDAVCFQASETSNTKDDYWITTLQKEGVTTYLITSKNSTHQFKTWLAEKSPDLVVVCGFSIKIPEEVLDIPTYGFLNIHFGKLPENRGPDPLYYSISSGEKETAITIHQMDKNWDTGPVLLKHPIPIVPGETWGMLNSKMSNVLGGLTQKALELVCNPKNFIWQETENTGYYPRPNQQATTIQWERQTADEILRMVNACNSKYGGALTYYQGAAIKIIEVTPVARQALLGKTPGEIIHAHPQQGLYVYCKYGELLRVDIISSDAGILSGTKYVLLGVRQGHCFTSEACASKTTLLHHR